MYRQVASLVVFREFGGDSVLERLAAISRELSGEYDRDELRGRVCAEVKRLLDLATEYGFDENLWQDYLTFLLLTNENSFSLTAEKRALGDGSIGALVRRDMEVFRELFHFDFGPLERALGLDCFSVLTRYQAVPKEKKNYFDNISRAVREMSGKLAAAENGEEMFALLSEFYRANGVGMFGLNRAFRIREGEGHAEIYPINNTDEVRLSDLVGYELQKERLIRNTESFLAGGRANNVLLYGDAGTGKSTSVKAILNEYAGEGLRMIEIYKHQFRMLTDIIGQIKRRNYKFIIFMDDLSFEEFEIEYKYLKAVIEGGVESRPDNVLIYATSNRRHLIRESFGDRADDVHRTDSMAEKTSLADRFGVSILFATPDKPEYHEIVKFLAAKHPELALPEEELLARADSWAVRNGGISCRTAQQFINDLLTEIK